MNKITASIAAGIAAAAIGIAAPAAALAATGEGNTGRDTATSQGPVRSTGAASSKIGSLNSRLAGLNLPKPAAASSKIGSLNSRLAGLNLP